MQDLQKQLQQCQDMLQGSINQRNASQNECLQLAAQVAELSRNLETANKRVAELEAPDVPKKANGKHAEGARA